MNINRIKRITTIILVLIAAVYYFTVDTFAADDKTAQQAVNSFKNAEAAADYMREQMKQRETTITFEYTTKDEHDSVLYDLIEKAFAHTGAATEGDYLKYQFERWDGKYTYTKAGDTYNMLVTYNMKYFTDSKQEQAADALVGNALTKLQLEGKSDYEKVKAIYDFVCENVDYDYENVSNQDNKTKYTAYSALNSHKAVCQGYAVLIYRIMLEAGIDCRVVSGDGDGQSHTWNIVKIGTAYYNLDATWDSQSQIKMFFLKCDDKFIKHERNEEYRTKDFYANYPMSQNNYEGHNSYFAMLSSKLVAFIPNTAA